MATSCAKKGPETDAKKFMEKFCELQGTYEQLYSATEDKRGELEKKAEILGKELETLNNEIMKKYENDTAAMRVMQEFTANYECPKSK
ncbi:MAG: hypothetical protein RSC04_06395 [Bacteroidales bacterium]